MPSKEFPVAEPDGEALLAAALRNEQGQPARSTDGLKSLSLVIAV